MSFNQSEQKNYIITHTCCYDFKTYKENCFIHFNKTIQCVDSMDAFDDYIKTVGDYDLIDGGKLLILPGLIAGHTHIYSTFARGLSLPFKPTSFMDILEQLWWRVDRALNLKDVYYSGLVAGLDFVKSGVTTVFDHHASGAIEGSLNALSLSISEDIGIRGGFCFETSDRFDVNLCIKENNHFMEAAMGSQQRFGLFGLHASMTLSDETLEKVKAAIGDKPIHIHVAESIEDQEDCLKEHDKRIVQRLYDFGLLNKGSILAHCLYIDDEEAKLIAEQGCYIAINVTSNMNNSVGLPNIELYKKHHIKCLIGNDGMTSDIASEWRNLLFAMHFKTNSPTGCSLDDIKAMINNAYDYANSAMDCQIGYLKQGFDSDLIAVNYSPPTPISKDNIFGHIIYGLSHNFRPQAVWCQGNQLLSDYKPDETYYKDVLLKLSTVQELAQALWDKILKG